MSIRQIDARLWRVDARVWLKGKEHRKRETIAGGKKAADARLRKLQKELRETATRPLEKGSLTAPDFKMFGEVLNFYCQNKASPQSHAGSYFKRLAPLGNVPLEGFSKVFKEFIRLERQSISKRTGRPLTVGTINKLKVFSLAALNFAAREERIKENPLRYIRKEQEEPRRVFLTLDDEKRLLEAVDELAPYLLPFVQYALYVPCRKGEMLSAGKECYHTIKNQIVIPGHLTKNGCPCTKPVPPHLTEYFRKIPKDCAWLFYRYKKSEYLPLGDIRKVWRKCVEKAKLGNLRIHDLRHHAVTRLIDVGNPRQWVIQIAGWKNDMLRVYWNQDEATVAEKIVFFPKPDTRPDTLRVASA